ncbi:hypothetical protein L2E82_05930 [Cichorium intybus]|uniref:Uncharacterized protein n=1 Tax=Cichorium intybus TaxID=13427 RepID=A0ACB9H9R3_CICIN|nr:hypothetical protein L2E82_05930 [Cichorium intybus]
MTLMGSDRATWRNIRFRLYFFHCIFYSVYIFIHFPQVTWKKRFESRCHSIHTNPFAFQTKKTHKERFRISLRSSKDPSVGFFTKPPFIYSWTFDLCLLL